MILFIFILVYLISVAICLFICLIICYYDNKETIHAIGDLLDETEGFMWCPFLNTGLLVVFCLCLGIATLCEKFRNIKSN